MIKGRQRINGQKGLFSDIQQFTGIQDTILHIYKENISVWLSPKSSALDEIIKSSSNVHCVS